VELFDVIIAAKSGDAEAFAALYDEYAGRVYRYVRIRIGTDSDSEDLTEQVFLRAWQRYPGTKNAAGLSLPGSTR